MGLFDGVFKSGGQLEVDYRDHMEIAQRRISAAQQQAQYKMGAQAIKTATRFDPNKSEAFQIPLSQAITMWKLKFGDTWYDGERLRPDPGNDFYADVFDRLSNAKLFERVDGWYRLKEGV